MEKFKAGDKVRLVVKDQYAKKPNVKNGVFLFSPAGNEWVVNIQENKMVRLECCEDWELDTEAQPEPKPMLGTITPVTKLIDDNDRIVAIEKRVAELEKKANKSEEAIIREFVEWMNEEGWVQLHEDTDKYIKEVLNK